MLFGAWTTNAVLVFRACEKRSDAEFASALAIPPKYGPWIAFASVRCAEKIRSFNGGPKTMSSSHTRSSPPPFEETLHAYIDGEFDPAESRMIMRRIESDEDSRRRLEVLGAVKHALLEAKPETSELPPTVASRLREIRELVGEDDGLPAEPCRVLTLWTVSSVAAAIILVALLVISPGRSNRETARGPRMPVATGAQEDAGESAVESGSATGSNEFLRFSVGSGKARLLDDVVLTAKIEALKGFAFLLVLPWRPGVTLEALARDLHPAPGEKPVLPVVEMPGNPVLHVVVAARVTTPSGEHLEGRLLFPRTPTLVPMVVKSEVLPTRMNARIWSFTIPLSRILVRSRDPRAYLAIARDGGQKSKNVAVEPEKLEEAAGGERWHRLLVTETGRYTIELTLHSIPSREADRWPSFDRPVHAASHIEVSGVTGEWSRAAKGLRMRLASPRRSYGKGERMPLILQVQNRAGAARKYEFCGATKVPSYDFEFFVDGAEDPARFVPERHGKVAIRGGELAEHPPSTTRTIVVPGEAWAQDGIPLNDRPGRLSVSARFRFRPSLFTADDRVLWKGEIRVPPIELRVQSPGKRSER